MSIYQSSLTDSSFLLSGKPIDPAVRASLHGTDAELQAMLDKTRELFGENVEVVLEEDPELPNDVHVVFNVKTHGDVDQVLAKEDDWHARCIRHSGKARMLFRLKVDILS